MKLLYDLSASQPAQSSKFHGGSEYAKTVFRELVKNKSNNLIEVFINPHNYIDEELTLLCEENDIKINECSSVDEISKLIEKNEYDSFYTALPYTYSDLKIPKKTKFIYTIHGLRGIEMLGDKYEGMFVKKDIKFFGRKFLIKFFPEKLVEHRKVILQRLFDITPNSEILVASYHTKYALLNHFESIDEDKIHVLYSPEKVVDSINFDNEEAILLQNNVEAKKYILMISGDRWLKNNYRAAKALDRLFSQNRLILKDIKVLILGVNNKDIYYSQLVNKEKFMIEGYKDPDDLEVLYKNAHILLYPTLNEGFGYPPLETMKYGTMVAVSAISSVTEVCGDAVLYFNPYDLNEINNRVLESFDIDIVKEKKELMKKQYEKISLKQKNSLKNIVKVIFN